MTSIVDILEELGIEYKLHGQDKRVSRGWAGTRCPVCGTDENYLGFPLSGRGCHCWCHGRCDARAMLAALSGRRPVDIAVLTRLLPSVGPIPERTGGIYRPPATVPMTGIHRDYLRSRGFDPETIERTWGVRAVAVDGITTPRIFIPVSYRGRDVSWVTRSVLRKSYISAEPSTERTNHKTLLYGEDYAGNSIVVTEGPIGAWAFGMGAVAVFGTAVSDAQLLKIVARPVRTFVFDGEPFAQDKARELVERCSRFPGSTYNVVLETGNDPPLADPAEIEDIKKRFLGD